MPAWIALAVGAACLLAWLVLLARVMARRPPPEARVRALAVWQDVAGLVERLTDEEELPAEVRSRARRASLYARWPIDLWPFSRVDDLVFALGAIDAAAEARGLAWVEDRWPGDEAGLNALRSALGREERWEP